MSADADRIAAHQAAAQAARNKAKTHWEAADLHWADYERTALTDPIQGRLDRALALAQTALGDAYAEATGAHREAADILSSPGAAG